MEGNHQLSFPEEDEDLEALRLAALQSLKRKTSNEMGYFNDKMGYFIGSPRGKSKRGRFPRQLQGRPPRNGQFNGWTRNSNLIAVPMVTEAENHEDNKRVVPDDPPKLVLPQDRYYKLQKTPEKSDTLTSKFDRYDNSDASESDSDEEPSKPDEEKSGLPRSSSLEAIMADLENEIHGIKPEEAPKAKPKKKRKLSVAPTSPKPVESKPPPVLKENLKPDPEPNTFRHRKWPKPRRNPPPSYPPPVHHPPPEIIPAMVAFVPPPQVQTFPPFGPIGFDGVYVPPPVVFEAPPPQLPPMCIAPPLYERPMSPLAINTEAFSTSTLAPLSPRSAAFVMENRAIVEKRKRRSWSRSPSPGRFRRSKTPKRLSLSPKRPSRSPKRRSLSPSPVRKVLLPRTNSPKKPPVHDRLGLKAGKTEPEEDKEKNKAPKKEEKKDVLDPVLEARRRKFERKEITMTEGVIRLKKEKQEEAENEKKEEAKKGDEAEQEEEEIDEDALLEGDGDLEDALLLDHKMDLFSDEESDSDNEGRFKTKNKDGGQKSDNQKVSILPFAKLINGSKGRKTDPKPEQRKDRGKSDRRKRFRSRTPVKSPAKKIAPKKEKTKQPIGFASERKIEIKIRNPAKYEKADAKSGEEKARKVEVAKNEEEIDAVEGSAEEANISEGDLRAQLSRKRAERQKHPLPDVVPSRLLQNALQGVGFRKGKKSKNKDESSEGKLPIHLRLGAATASPETFGKKSRKHSKNKGASQEQDYTFIETKRLKLLIL